MACSTTFPANIAKEVSFFEGSASKSRKGGDVKGSYDGTVPFGGRGFCESVGFEPSCTYNPRISNAVDLEPILP